MATNTVKLTFDESLLALHGYEFGVQIYQDQVKGKLDLDKLFTIVFPSNIEMVASTFTQGFFEDLITKIGISGIKEHATIICNVEQGSVLSEKILKDLY